MMVKNYSLILTLILKVTFRVTEVIFAITFRRYKGRHPASMLCNSTCPGIQHTGVSRRVTSQTLNGKSSHKLRTE